MKKIKKTMFINLSIVIMLSSMAWRTNGQVPGNLPWTPGTNCEGNQTILDDGMLVVTCGSVTDNIDEPVLAIKDVRGLTYSTSVQTPGEYYHPDWTPRRIGGIYMTETDPEGNIYAPASAVRYVIGNPPNTRRFGTIGGWPANPEDAGGTVYKIDATTGQASVFAVLPQQIYNGFVMAPNNFTPGLTGVAYDARCRMLYVANAEDGKIYRIDESGTVLDNYDPFGADNGAAGPAPFGERVMGLDIYNDKLYFTVQNNNPITTGFSFSDGSALVASINIDNCGFGTNETIEIDQYFNGYFGNEANSYAMIADIDFSLDGKMAIGYYSGFYTLNHPTYGSGDGFLALGNHDSPVLVYESFGDDQWLLTTSSNVAGEYYSGGSGGSNRSSTGGVAWNRHGAGTQLDMLWMSGGDFAGNDGDWGVIGYEFDQLDDYFTFSLEDAGNYVKFLFEDGNTDPKGLSGTVTLYAGAPSNDCDGDGVNNPMDVCHGHDDNLDNDMDNVPDGCDLDDDNDGILDELESFPIVGHDSDGDGIDDARDLDCDGTLELIQGRDAVAIHAYNTTFFPDHDLITSDNRRTNVNSNYSYVVDLGMVLPAGATVLVEATRGSGTAILQVEESLDATSFSNASNITYSSSQDQTFPYVLTNDARFVRVIASSGTVQIDNISYQAFQLPKCGGVIGAVKDTDSDTTPDKFDLDSDEDGCSDAIEGAGSFTAMNILNDTLTGGIDATGVPTLASPAGQGIGTSIDNGVQDPDCVTATITANDDNFTGNPFNPTLPGATASVFLNNGNGEDDADGSNATDANIDDNISIVNNDGLTGAAINSSGVISFPANSTPNTYNLEYRICLESDNTICDTATVSLIVGNCLDFGTNDCDGDGVVNSSDVCEGFDDTIDMDGDLVPDGCDLDDDNDGILDSVEGVGDLDNDGIVDSKDPDSDGDGCPDADEAYAAEGTDSNNDGTYGGVIGSGNVNVNGLVVSAGINGAGDAYTTTPAQSGGDNTFQEAISLTAGSAPADDAQCAGSGATLSAGAATAETADSYTAGTPNYTVIDNDAGAGINYQWQADGVDILPGNANYSGKIRTCCPLLIIRV